MNPPSGNGLVSFHVRIFRDTWRIRLGGIILPGRGALLPGGRMARDAAGFASFGYQRLRGSRISEKSPERMAKVGTAPVEGVARRSRRASQFTSQKGLSFLTGPEATAPY